MSFSVKYIMKLTEGCIYSNTFQTGCFRDPHFGKNYTKCVGRQSAVSIAARNGLDGPGFEYQCRRTPPTSRPAVGLTQTPEQRVLGLSRRQSAREFRCPPTPSSAEVEGRVEYTYSPPLGLRGLF
jgi:hypothetical protein